MHLLKLKQLGHLNTQHICPGEPASEPLGSKNAWFYTSHHSYIYMYMLLSWESKISTSDFVCFSLAKAISDNGMCYFYSQTDFEKCVKSIKTYIYCVSLAVIYFTKQILEQVCSVPTFTCSCSKCSCISWTVLSFYLTDYSKYVGSTFI